MSFLLIGLALTVAAPQHVPDAYQRAIEQYRAERVAELTADDGWLTVAGLFWLAPGANTAGSGDGNAIVLPAKAPARVGTFTLSKDGAVTFTAADGVRATAAGAPVTTFAFDPKKGDDSAIDVGDLTMFVIKRGERHGIRLRDRNSDERRGFQGLRYFPISTSYRLAAHFVPYGKPKMVPVPNVLGDIVQMESPGYVTFSLNGREYRLDPVYETSKHEDLFFIFKDRTSVDATYPAGRFLHTMLPKDGRVIIDFNKAYNPPCAFTAFATCPLPRRENQLPVRIEAGELNYHHR